MNFVFSEPKFRGVMIAYTHVGWTLGMLLLSVLNTLMPWRSVAFVCLFVPVITTIALCFVSHLLSYLEKSISKLF